MSSIAYTCLLLLLVTVVIAQDEGQACGENEFYTTCGSPCVETCTEKPGLCAAMCMFGCFCKPGYVRESNKPGSPCIKQEECQPIDVHQCGKNEEFMECGSACPQRCDMWTYPTPKPPANCMTICKPSCFCKAGFYRSNNGACVKPEECCGDNEVFTDCGSACVETCQSKPEICTEGCITGCFCRQGYIRSNNTIDGSCILRNQCSK